MEKESQTLLSYRALAEAQIKRRKSYVDSSSETALAYVVRKQWTFSPKIFQRAAVDFPMTVKWTINGVGNTSCDVQLSYFVADKLKKGTEDGTRQTPSPATTSDRFLASCVIRFVNVDAVSRRPAPFPPETAEDLRYCVSADGEKLTVLRPPSTIPSRTFSCRVIVRSDDTDFNGHTNTGSYLMFAQECAAQAAESGFYSHVKGDIAFYLAKSANILLMSESEVGDELIVLTWEDADNKMFLNFLVSRNGELISFAQIHFFSPEDIVLH